MQRASPLGRDPSPDPYSEAVGSGAEAVPGDAEVLAAAEFNGRVQSHIDRLGFPASK